MTVDAEKFRNGLRKYGIKPAKKLLGEFAEAERYEECATMKEVIEATNYSEADEDRRELGR